MRERFGSKCFRIFRLLLLKYVGTVTPPLLFKLVKFPGFVASSTEVVELVLRVYVDRGVEARKSIFSSFSLPPPSHSSPSSLLPLSSLPSSPRRLLEQHQVAEMAMIPSKEAKEMLYSLLAENFVTLQVITPPSFLTSPL